MDADGVDLDGPLVGDRGDDLLMELLPSTPTFANTMMSASGRHASRQVSLLAGAGDVAEPFALSARSSRLDRAVRLPPRDAPCAEGSLGEDHTGAVVGHLGGELFDLLEHFRTRCGPVDPHVRCAVADEIHRRGPLEVFLEGVAGESVGVLEHEQGNDGVDVAGVAGDHDAAATGERRWIRHRDRDAGERPEVGDVTLAPPELEAVVRRQPAVGVRRPLRNQTVSAVAPMTPTSRSRGWP